MGRWINLPTHLDLTDDSSLKLAIICTLSDTLSAIGLGIDPMDITQPVGLEEVCNPGWHCGCYMRYGHNAKDQGTLPG
jgi:hypothetical protein